MLKGLNIVSVTVTDLVRRRALHSDVLKLGKPWFDGGTMGWIEWRERGKDGNFAVTLEGNRLQAISDPPGKEPRIPS